MGRAASGQKKVKPEKMQDLKGHDGRRHLKITLLADRGFTGRGSQDNQKIIRNENTAKALSKAEGL